MLGLLGLQIFEATATDIADLDDEHGHRVLRVCGKGAKVVMIPPPPAVGRAIDRAVGARSSGPILLNSRGARPWHSLLTDGKACCLHDCRVGSQGHNVITLNHYEAFAS